LTGKVPVVRVSTYSTHYQKLSSQTRQYAKWYKHIEQPQMSDKDFYRADEFTIELADFTKRFGEGKR
jgi:hypothetical protein